MIVYDHRRKYIRIHVRMTFRDSSISFGADLSPLGRRVCSTYKAVAASLFDENVIAIPRDVGKGALRAPSSAFDYVCNSMSSRIILQSINMRCKLPTWTLSAVQPTSVQVLNKYKSPDGFHSLSSLVRHANWIQTISSGKFLLGNFIEWNYYYYFFFQTE